MTATETVAPPACIRLPFPPTVNTYWRHIVMGGRPRTLISKRGRAYRQEVLAAVLESGVRNLRGRLHVVVRATMPDRRIRDLDNLGKGLLDALADAKVYADDGHIDHLEFIRAGVEAPGWVDVEIRAFGEPA